MTYTDVAVGLWKASNISLNMYSYLNRIIHWEIEKNQRNKGKVIRIHHCYVENINESDE